MIDPWKIHQLTCGPLSTLKFSHEIIKHSSMGKSSVDCWYLTWSDVQKHQSFVVTRGNCRSYRWIWSIDHSHVYLAVVWSGARGKLEDSFVECHESCERINTGCILKILASNDRYRNALLNLVLVFVVIDHVICHECNLFGLGFHRCRGCAVPAVLWC